MGATSLETLSVTPSAELLKVMTSALGRTGPRALLLSFLMAAVLHPSLLSVLFAVFHALCDRGGVDDLEFTFL
jgi:hypothetical protein